MREQPSPVSRVRKRIHFMLGSSVMLLGVGLCLYSADRFLIIWSAKAVAHGAGAGVLVGLARMQALMTPLLLGLIAGMLCISGCIWIGFARKIQGSRRNHRASRMFTQT